MKSRRNLQGSIVLTAFSHVATGFGLALLLQHYIIGHAVLPALIGGLLVGFSIAVHVYEFTVPE